MSPETPLPPGSLAAGAAAPLLQVRGLDVRFGGARGAQWALRDIDLDVARGECLAVVGESGAGKSQLFLAAMGLLPANGHATGSVRYAGRELLGLPQSQLDRVRGAEIGMVFQDPLGSLTPHRTIGQQMTEVLVRHQGASRTAAHASALELLARVRVSEPRRRLAQYPGELSGGMRQRVMIAMAISTSPQLLIADEPTTALDVTVQAQILALLLELKRERRLALVLITHDLGAVAGLADRVLVLRHGRTVESDTVTDLLGSPRAAYSRALLADARALAQPPPATLPRLQSADAVGAPLPAGVPPLLEVSGLSVRFPVRGQGWRVGAPQGLQALQAIDLSVGAGESVAVVGESGSGKSTLVRAALALVPRSAGRIVWLGRDVGSLTAGELQAARRRLPIVFQDPFGSLDPRMTVAQAITEPLRVHEPALSPAARQGRVGVVMEALKLPASLAARYPHELSGGQCQRTAIARAMILEPQLLVCDEPLSALDVSTQHEVVELLAGLRQHSGMGLLFVTHNLALARRLCTRVLVLYLGRMLELADAQRLFTRPAHPYTRELLAAIPLLDAVLQPRRLAQVRGGEVPSPLAPPSGCVYRTRCPHAVERCTREVPSWEADGAGGLVACHRWRELPAP
ncbi:MAG: ABC transporter ATP-binding protein [Proteobacteria bacterium]|nr:ABC transporter ATP-binding protein [Pseudomonadota bacterium]